MVLPVLTSPYGQLSMGSSSIINSRASLHNYIKKISIVWEFPVSFYISIVLQFIVVSSMAGFSEDNSFPFYWGGGISNHLRPMELF